MNQTVKSKIVETVSFKGLVYERFPSQKSFTWNEAVEYLKKLREETSKNWRFATVEELQKLYTTPNKKIFQRLKNSWSRNEEGYHNAWVMDFENNIYYPRNKEMMFHLICVQDTTLKRSINFYK